MARILIKNLGKEVITADVNKPILWLALHQQIDWMHSCGGKGRCTTCKAEVLSGDEHLSLLSPAEIKYRTQGLLKENERLACQTRLTGDVEVKIPEECKLPHLNYLD
jgi:2Fe-2S ferredoxin